VFSLAVIAALCLAMVPAPVYALSASAATTASVGSVVTQANAPVLPNSVLICRIVVVRHNGHTLKALRCIHLQRPD
jgi:acyl dehydratase